MVYESNYRPARHVYDDELMHYGVKGMRWGHRKAAPTTSYGNARAEYKAAKKAYNKAWNRASGYSGRHAIGQYVNKNKKAESNRRWDDAMKKGDALNRAEANYKKAKQERKQAISSAKSTYKSAKKAYNKSFNSAYNYSGRHAIGQYVNKDKKAESNRRWDDAYNKSVALNNAKNAYKKTKSDYRRG